MELDKKFKVLEHQVATLWQMKVEDLSNKERRCRILVDWRDHKEARRVDGLSRIFSTARSAFQDNKNEETEEQGFQECSLIIVE